MEIENGIAREIWKRKLIVTGLSVRLWNIISIFFRRKLKPDGISNNSTSLTFKSRGSFNVYNLSFLAFVL